MQSCTRFETQDSGLLLLCQTKKNSGVLLSLFLCVSNLRSCSVSLTIFFFLQVITSAIPENVGGKLIGLVNTRDEIPDLLKVRTEV